MGSRLDTTITRLQRVKDATTSYMHSGVFYHKTHAWLLNRMSEVRKSQDFQKLPRWAQSQVDGYTEGYFRSMYHHLEWRLHRISDGAYIKDSDVDWGARDVDGGAHFWKGTDIMY